MLKYMRIYHTTGTRVFRIAMPAPTHLAISMQNSASLLFVIAVHKAEKDATFVARNNFYTYSASVIMPFAANRLSFCCIKGFRLSLALFYAVKYTY